MQFASVSTRVSARSPCTARAVTARAGMINQDIGKTQDKVVNTINVGKSADIQKKVRCATFGTSSHCAA
jgi:hypothetical protein